MQPPVFVSKGSILLAGVGFFGDPFQISGDWSADNEIGRLWTRLMVYQNEHADTMPPSSQPGVYYEVHIEHNVTRHTGEYEVFIGFEIAQSREVPVDLLIKALPPADYAVFTLRGDEITVDWSQSIFHDWFAGSGYQPAQPYSFQWYDQRFKGLDQIGDSELDVYVPIMPAEDASSCTNCPQSVER